MANNPQHSAEKNNVYRNRLLDLRFKFRPRLHKVGWLISICNGTFPCCIMQWSFQIRHKGRGQTHSWYTIPQHDGRKDGQTDRKNDVNFQCIPMNFGESRRITDLTHHFLSRVSTTTARPWFLSVRLSVRPSIRHVQSKRMYILSNFWTFC